MDADLKLRVERAKELLKTVRHASIATVNVDGSPHNSPVLLFRSDDLSRIYWGSHPESVHSKNIVRTGQLFVVLYDARERGGLYIRANNGHIAEGDYLDEALMAHNAYRTHESKDMLKREYYDDESPQRMWMADVSELWVNSSKRGADGLIIRDFRYKISTQDLLS